jgi:putative membrane-bound dehydrogenase-like protein
MRRWPAFLVLSLTVLLPAGGADDPVPPERAAAMMKLPDGFGATLFAGEPNVVKPMAMTLDDRGRLWVVESHSYPHWITDGKPGKDRILIFEDTKGTGRFDKRTIFWDKGTNLSGIALGFGGVWLCATPNLLFIPVRAGEDKPAGDPEVVLDGWDLKAQHNVFNSLTWGPDGWLYGCNGILSNSRLGRPGTPDARRVAINCGVWRYHPTKKAVEAFAWGTTNPWGLDFDDYGEMFITNCVIKHLFHVVPGSHFERMFGQDLNPYCYGLMQSCADHIHWAGGSWTSSRGGEGAHNAPGGGHAHAGAMVYLGDNWPDVYRNRIFMCNLHGNRVNQDVLERRGSGYVARHGQDFLMAHDPWFRGLALQYGPDGGVYASDWHDTGECHNHDKTHPSGRIYKITYGKPKAVEVDLAKLADAELVKLQLHKNDWWVRHARRLLQERADSGKLDKTVRPALLKMLADQKEVTRKLRALWALHAIRGFDTKTLTGLLDSPEDTVRVWAVRLLVEDREVSDGIVAQFGKMAQTEKSASVRLALASALQRLPLDQRLPLAESLVARAEDANDANLPLMIWYGIEPLAPRDIGTTMSLMAKARIPLLRQYLGRRLAASDKQREWLYPIISLIDDAPSRLDLLRDLLRGMCEALQGQPGLSGPPRWIETLERLRKHPDNEVREKAILLSVLYGDREAIAALRKTVTDPKAPDPGRRTALQTLVEAKAPDLAPLLRELVTDRTMRRLALRALARYDDDRTPAKILKHYASFDDAAKTDAIATLASRPGYAMALLEAMEKGAVPRRDLSAFTARQLMGLKNPRLTERLTKVWGTIRKPDHDKTTLLHRYLSLVPPDALKKANRSQGRLVFSKTCASCHTLFGEGGKIGPELTGSQRDNPEYVVTKLLDPSAVVARDFQVTNLITKDGRSLSGIVKEESEKVVALQTQNEVVRVAKADIEVRERSEQSMMPDGLLDKLKDAEVRDLIAYLAGAGQVPLPRSAPAKPADK